MSKRNTLICTVGTSLFEGNLSRLSAATPNAPANWEAIRRAYDAQNWRELATELLRIPPTERLCGAEINTIEEARRKKWLSLENLIFLVSDTPIGQNTGQFLQIYFENRSDLKLRNVEYIVVEQLQDQRPTDFKIHGLRNLVRKCGEIIQRFGGPEYVAIDATGGYKAQIAVAVIMGQVLDIPVFYKHERFSEIIDFPPLPVAFDYDLLGRNSWLLTDFEKGEALSEDEIGRVDEKLKVLLIEVEMDGTPVYELSPVGQIYLDGFRIRHPKPIQLVPATGEQKKQPRFGDDNYPKGFAEFVEKVWRETPWVKTAFSLPYDKQSAIKGTGFHVWDNGQEKQLVGTYQDRSGFGARFRLLLTDESPQALVWAADQLNQRYRSHG
ncbi:MAG: putative CRISPR-associated protein [Gloeomargarita sp. SKYG116]|nr:putative CRISPR-associated protein [Gloeomargarita sp. SKYG116]MDW8401737.1 putative CRISPR-associated protein [Gloeomargarita sp. SKYGB_i_bin116]